DRGDSSFRTRQLQRWIFQQRAANFEAMTDLPKALREALAEAFTLWRSSIVDHHRAADGTEKLVLEYPAKSRIECVLIRDGLRRTICVSSQVGCAMGCVFCASGLDGVERNLSRGEILEQALRLQHLLPDQERLSHIVVMGMGEPLANLDSVIAALDVASHPEGLGISPRRITISTVGLPSAMRRLAAERPQYRLAVSLHAPHDELRNRLVLINRKVGLPAILEAADEYAEVTNNRLTFEYVLLGGVNDAPRDAEQLAHLLADRSALLNVIPYNPVPGLPYRPPSLSAIQRFREILQRQGINVQIRERKGDEIQAACGQLRRSQPIDHPEPASPFERSPLS
ncbi:MAG TPA: 23S rRNA (adenine(2503)-C(2))-methyltransferase RlmN, partial [Pirellulaceae bacterium]